MAQVGLPGDYAAFLESLKDRIRQAQTKAMLSVNRELIQLYWDLGRRIVDRQEKEGWGKSVVDRLAGDLQRAFPGIGGFSASNVSRMRAFYLAYVRAPAISAQPAPKLKGKKSARAVPKSPEDNAAQPVWSGSGDQPPPPLAEIPWGHNVVLLFKLSDPAERLWYAAKTLEHGWSRAVLTAQIEKNLYGRQGKAITNFTSRLPAPQSDLAQQSLKDPYLFAHNPPDPVQDSRSNHRGIRPARHRQTDRRGGVADQTGPVVARVPQRKPAEHRGD